MRQEAGPRGKALLRAAAGAVGTWTLDRADWRMWDHESDETWRQTSSVRPYGEPPAQVLAREAENGLGFAPTTAQHEAAAGIIHYGIGIAPAAAYSLLRDRLPGRGPFRGAAFGLGLFLAQDEVLNTITGLGASPRRYPWQAHARGLVAHLIYGMVTETVLNAAGKGLKGRGRVSA